MTLFLDTTDRNSVYVSLQNAGEMVSQLRHEGISRQSQVILPLVEQLLTQAEVQLNDLDSIEVACGPGSFTGTRVGVTVANGLSLALGISVNGLPIGQFALPIYSEPAKITLPKQITD